MDWINGKFLEAHDVRLSVPARLSALVDALDKAHDFQLWRMEVKRVRYIGGFGHIFWIEQNEWQLEAPQFSLEDEARMVEHMNEDHRDANQLILKLIHNIEADDVVMTTLVSDGCYLRANEKNYFIQFETPCHDGMSVRKELVRLTKAARSQAETVSA